MSNQSELSELFKQAAAIAAVVPESLREIAFQRALDSLLAPTPLAPTPTSTKSTPLRGGAKTRLAQPGKQSVKTDRTAVVTSLLERLDRTLLAPALRGRKVLDKSLLVLREAERNDVAALSPTDISAILRDKYREPAAVNAVRMALDRSPGLTDRRPDGQGYLYSLMAAGEEYLDALDQAPNSSAASPRKKGPPPKKSSGSKVVVGSPRDLRSQKTVTPKQAAPARKAKSRGGRPGPMGALTAMIAEGFFSAPRSIGTMLAHLKEAKAVSFRATDLSPTLQRLIRKQALRRTKNSAGQYEYIAE